MLPNISIQKAQLIKQKLEEIKNTLDQDIISHSSNGVNIEISVLGNIKKISKNISLKTVFIRMLFPNQRI